jgi:hypothetical protein
LLSRPSESFSILRAHKAQPHDIWRLQFAESSCDSAHRQRAIARLTSATPEIHRPQA